MEHIRAAVREAVKRIDEGDPAGAKAALLWVLTWGIWEVEHQ